MMPQELAALRSRLVEARSRQIGFPVATDINYSDVAWVHDHFSNNLGDPLLDTGRWPVHTKEIERLVLDAHAELFGGLFVRRATSTALNAVWGYVTAGGTSEGVRRRALVFL